MVTVQGLVACDACSHRYIARSRSAIVGRMYGTLWLTRCIYLRHTSTTAILRSSASRRRPIETRRRRRLVLLSIGKRTRECQHRARAAP